MRSVAVNTELHERFEKHLVGLISQMDFKKFRISRFYPQVCH